MNPLCPNCLNEMSKAATSRNLFHCEPCREIIQFFGVGPDRSDASPDFWLPVRRKRDGHGAHAHYAAAFSLRMISAQTRSALVTPENRYTLVRIMR